MLQRFDWFITFLRSTVGRKAVMAVTGAALVAFVIGHLAGNLQVFLGPEKLNAYAELLKSHLAALWGVRLTLLAILLVHVFVAGWLTIDAWRARPVAYARQAILDTSFAARTMRWTGPLLALFLVYHLLHLTLGRVGPAGWSETDVYANVIIGFRAATIAGLYVAAMIALGLHLYHGIWSLLQSLGISHPKYDLCFKLAGILVALAVLAGNSSIPLAILAGLVGERP